MVKDLLGLIAEGLYSPRLSARKILDGNHGMDAVVLMVALSYLVQAILAIIITGRAASEEDHLFFGHLLAAVVHIGLFLLIVMLAFGIGKVLGGRGTRQQAFQVIGWHTLVTTLLAPVFLLAQTQMTPDGAPGIVIAVFLMAGGVWLWVLANFVAELHGFQSVWSTLAGVFAVAMLMAGLMTALFQTPG
ncbi:MAG: YIP1 family protein [Pseudomonadota bacterium]